MQQTASMLVRTPMAIMQGGSTAVTSSCMLKVFQVVLGPQSLGTPCLATELAMRHVSSIRQAFCQRFFVDKKSRVQAFILRSSTQKKVESWF